MKSDATGHIARRQTAMTIELQCAKRGFTDKRWRLNLTNNLAVITTPEGEEICRFTNEQAAEQWIYPQFGGDTKYFTINHADQQVPFKVSREGLKQIKRFLLQSVVNGGEDAVQEFKSKAGMCFVVGVASLLLGIAATFFSYQMAAQKPEGGTYWIFTGLVFFGLYRIFRGMWLMSQTKELNSLADEQSGGSGQSWRR
jgi:hypothetical protein